MKHNLEGKKFGRLTVLSYGCKRKNKHYYKCKCECGNNKEVYSYNLMSGHTKSCGCLNLDVIKGMKTRKTHGKSKTRLHNIWWGIINRCENEKNRAYEKYGARGIIICEEWRGSFTEFEEWALKNGYKEDLSIDRINNDGNYEPGNCRWVNSRVQNNNKSNNVKIEIDGVIKNLSEWASYSGLHRSTISRKLKKGITGKKLLEKSVNQWK